MRIENKDNLIMQLNQQIATMQQPEETDKNTSSTKPKRSFNF